MKLALALGIAIAALCLSSSVLASDYFPRHLLGDFHAGIYSGIDGSFSVRAPELLLERVAIKDEIVTPGVTSEVAFFDGAGWYARIVSTKIHGGLSDYERLLERIERGQTQDYGDFVISKRFEEGSFGRLLLYGLKFPEGGNSLISSRTEDGAVVRMHPDRFSSVAFLVANGYLYELNYSLERPGSADALGDDPALSIAESNLRSFLAGFRPSRTLR